MPEIQGIIAFDYKLVFNVMDLKLSYINIRFQNNKTVKNKKTKNISRTMSESKAGPTTNSN